MSDRTFDIDDAGMDEALLQINRSIEGVDLSGVFRGEVVDILADSHESFFSGQRAPDGSLWAPLAPSTVKRKGHSVILIDTNRMQESLLFQGGDHIEEITPEGMTWGTSDPKARFHQEGTRRMPARPFVGITPQAADRIAEAVADKVIRQIRQPQAPQEL